MTSKSRLRLIIIIMVFLIAIMFSTLAIIFGTTKAQTTRKSKEMLQTFADSYDTKGFPSASTSGFFVSTFYAVSFDANGNVDDILNDGPSGFSDEELAEYAKNLLNSGKDYGEGETVTYLITRGDDYILVTMMDTVLMDLTISYLIKNMIVFGLVSIVILTILAIILSGWVMKPVETAYEKQKQFMSDAGHELKTPISTISANVEILRREMDSNPWLQNINYENERMSTIVHQLLDLARLETVKQAMSEVNISELALANVMPFEAAAFERGIEFNYTIEENIVKTCDGPNMEKLISILTDNAISHCSVGGKVHISLSKDNEKISLTASNTGEEIPVSDREMIFERFYKSDQSRTADNDHYGLGLSIAKAIVTEHSGKICVDCNDGNVIFKVKL